MLNAWDPSSCSTIWPRIRQASKRLSGSGVPQTNRFKPSEGIGEAVGEAACGADGDADCGVDGDDVVMG